MGWPSPSMHLPLLSPSLFSTLSLSPARARRSWRLHFAAAAAADGELQRRRPEGLSRRAEARRRTSDFDPRFFLFSSRRVKKKTGFIFFFSQPPAGPSLRDHRAVFVLALQKPPFASALALEKHYFQVHASLHFLLQFLLLLFANECFFVFASVCFSKQRNQQRLAPLFRLAAAAAGRGHPSPRGPRSRSSIRTGTPCLCRPRRCSCRCRRRRRSRPAQASSSSSSSSCSSFFFFFFRPLPPKN